MKKPLLSTFTTCYPLFLGRRLPNVYAIMEMVYLISEQFIAIKATEILPNISLRQNRLRVQVSPKTISRG